MNLRILLAAFFERFRAAREHPLERLAEIGLREGMSFLDVGCSLGFYSFCASSIVGDTGLVYALDIDPDLTSYVVRKARKEGIGNIKTMTAGAQETGLPPESVDVVFLHLVLHDVEEKQAAIKEFYRVLRPRGKLVIDEENTMPLDAIRELAEDSGFRLSDRLRKTTQVFERPDNEQT